MASKSIFLRVFSPMLILYALVGYTQEDKALEEVSVELTDSIKSRSKLNAFPYVFYTPESKFAVGSSANTSSGFLTIARAIATR